MLSTEAGIKVKSVFTPQDASTLILHEHINQIIVNVI